MLCSARHLSLFLSFFHSVCMCVPLLDLAPFKFKVELAPCLFFYFFLLFFGSQMNFFFMFRLVRGIFLLIHLLWPRFLATLFLSSFDCALNGMWSKWIFLVYEKCVRVCVCIRISLLRPVPVYFLAERIHTLCLRLDFIFLFYFIPHRFLVLFIACTLICKHLLFSIENLVERWCVSVSVWLYIIFIFLKGFFHFMCVFISSVILSFLIFIGSVLLHFSTFQLLMRWWFLFVLLLSVFFLLSFYSEAEKVEFSAKV